MNEELNEGTVEERKERLMKVERRNGRRKEEEGRGEGRKGGRKERGND